MRVIKYSILYVLMTVTGIQSYVGIAQQQEIDKLEEFAERNKTNSLTEQDQQAIYRIIRGLSKSIGEQNKDVVKYKKIFEKKMVTPPPLPPRQPVIQTQSEPQPQQIIGQQDADQFKRLQEEITSLRVSLQTKESEFKSTEQELKKEIEEQKTLLQQKDADVRSITSKETEEKQKAIKNASEYKAQLETVQKDLENCKIDFQNAKTAQDAIHAEKESLIEENRNLDTRKTQEIEDQKKTIENYQKSLAECTSKVDKMGGFNSNAASWQVIEQVIGSENMKNMDNAIRKYSKEKDQIKQAVILSEIRNQFSLDKLNSSTNAYQEYKNLLGSIGSIKMQELEQKNRENESRIKALEQEREINKKKIQELEQGQESEKVGKKELEDCKQQLTIEKNNVVVKQQKIHELEKQVISLQEELRLIKQEEDEQSSVWSGPSSFFG